jgi:hypothetical protein
MLRWAAGAFARLWWLDVSSSSCQIAIQQGMFGESLVLHTNSCRKIWMTPVPGASSSFEAVAYLRIRN